MTTLLKCVECSDGHLVLRTGRFGKFYACTNYPLCNGIIGAHQQPPYKPLGTPADPETRQLRIAVHDRLDRLWRGKRTRGKVYAALSAWLGVPYHTGEADRATCERLIDILDCGWRP